MKLIKLENGLFKLKLNNAEITLAATDNLAQAWEMYSKLQGIFPAPVKAPAKDKPKAPTDKPSRTPVMFDLLAKHESLTPAEMMDKAGFKDDNVKFWSAIALRAVQSKKLKRRKLKDGGFTYFLKPSKG